MMLRPRTTWESLTDPASPARRGGKKTRKSFVRAQSRTYAPLSSPSVRLPPRPKWRPQAPAHGARPDQRGEPEW
jgi:hypothetical protein